LLLLVQAGNSGHGSGKNYQGRAGSRGDTDEVAEQLKQDTRDRLSNAGIEVIEARLNHLAYSAEIASAMLRRQQAQAVIAARARIVEVVRQGRQPAAEH
jgi:hypothetical protein